MLGQHCWRTSGSNCWGSTASGEELAGSCTSSDCAGAAAPLVLDCGGAIGCAGWMSAASSSREEAPRGVSLGVLAVLEGGLAGSFSRGTTGGLEPVTATACSSKCIGHIQMQM